MSNFWRSSKNGRGSQAGRLKMARSSTKQICSNLEMEHLTAHSFFTFSSSSCMSTLSASKLANCWRHWFKRDSRSRRLSLQTVPLLQKCFSFIIYCRFFLCNSLLELLGGVETLFQIGQSELQLFQGIVVDRLGEKLCMVHVVELSYNIAAILGTLKTHTLRTLTTKNPSLNTMSVQDANDLHRRLYLRNTLDTSHHICHV